ncbi:hypothetical protein JCM33374_g2556 [Metschnikowia sp. JCM 33374]|nr:hypothetical protein JCM33374_g2556 [Metschnikowia sp. JCM 33374]
MSKTSLTVQTSLKVQTSLHIPITVVYSPDMPAASKVSSRPISWPEVQKIIATNDLDVFARSQSQTEKYLAFKRDLRLKGSTVYKHLLTNSLGWASEADVKGLADADIKVSSSGAGLFADASDLKIIRNDFPYYFEENVAHLCVWTKRPIESDPNSSCGDISPETRAIIEKYIRQTFVEKAGIPRENLLWFRNWEALQSVREISHVHVLVKDMTPAQVDMLVGTAGIPLKL